MGDRLGRSVPLLAGIHFCSGDCFNLRCGKLEADRYYSRGRFFLFVLAFSYSSWICLEISRKAGLDGLSDCWSAIILIPNAAFLPVVSLATTSFPLYRRPEGMTAGLAATFIAGLLWFFAGLLIAEFEAQFRRKPLVWLLRQTIFFYLMSISICLMVLLEYLIEGQFVYLFCYMGVLWAGWGVYWWSRDPVIAGGRRK